MLHFDSFYPSIIVAYNLSFETMILPSEPVADADCFVFPSAHSDTLSPLRFLKPEGHIGLLPTLITALLAARARAKEEANRCWDNCKEMPMFWLGLQMGG